MKSTVVYFSEGNVQCGDAEDADVGAAVRSVADNLQDHDGDPEESLQRVND